MVENINTLNCGTGAVGTWFDGCQVTMKDITKVFLVLPKFKTDLTAGTFDNAAIALLIKKGQLIPLNNIKQVTSADSKNTYQTFTNKQKLFVANGLYDFMIELEANICLVKSLRNLLKKNWSVMFLDREGKLFFEVSNGFMKGFDTSIIDVDNETTNDGGAKVAMITVGAQLSIVGTQAFNTRRSFLATSSTLDVNSFNGVQDTSLKALTLTAANFTVQVVSGCDNSTPILGLATANFRLVDATTGLTVVATALEVGNGVYKFSGAGVVAGAKTLQLYDSTLNVPVADILSTEFYSSNVIAVVIT